MGRVRQKQGLDSNPFDNLDFAEALISSKSKRSNCTLNPKSDEYAALRC